MSSTLLKYLLQDDVDSFKRLLANTSNAQAAQRSVGGNVSPKIGGPSIGPSSNLSPRNKKNTGTSPGSSFPERGSLLRGTASRAQVNARDRYGRTLLHLIASSRKPTAIEFATALLALPFVDIYAQDVESGWTALHRALYAGNAAVAQALMARDVRDATDFSTPSANSHSSGGLIKVKDREGNSPFDVYDATIVARDIKHTGSIHGSTMPHAPESDDASSINRSMYGDDDGDDGGLPRIILRPRVNIQADEVFTFGSNKNLTLGLGDEDDRHFPERIAVERPDHLLQRFYRERKSGVYDLVASQDFGHPTDLPTLVTNKPVVFQDVVMSKLSTAVLTNDPESNLFMCGFGPGGRLGTGDEATRFSFVCIETGGLAGKKIISVALGQDHSIAISEQGEIFTWGSNKYGQLGYNLPRTSNKKDTPVQSTPRQIFNPFKREMILGAAASSIHSVVFSTSGLYTFGKNEGQLGLVDSDARSLEVQVTPRRVGVSLFNSPIQMVSAIDKATTVLLESHDVFVFTQYGYSKVVFPLDISSSFIKESFLATRYGSTANRITKVTSGRNTICAMSSFGEVYTVQVNSKADTGSAASSTTNPAKIRNSLSSPERVWSVRKSHMAVRDVDVGQDGSIIICTTSGSAWRKEKRTKIKDAGSKDYKFVRVPGVSRVAAVRSNAFGAYAVAQRECDVAREQITVSPSTLWHDFFELLPFKDLANVTSGTLPPMSEETFEGLLSSTNMVQAAKIKAAVLSFPDIEDQIRLLLDEPVLTGSNPQGMVWIKSTVSDVRIPVHEFIMSARSAVLRMTLAEFRHSYFFSIPDFMAIEYDQHGHVQIIFQGVDFLSILNLAFFLYTDHVLDVWRDIKHSSVNAFRYRQVRTETMRIATHLDLQTLERAARIMVEPSPRLDADIARAMKDPCFFQSSDVTIQLKDETVRAHSYLLCQRCPFFEGLFHGRSGGRWLDSRRDGETISVDLKDIEPNVFDFVLRHLYSDTEEELFQDVRCSLDDFIDLILDVMSVANELMIDRLAQICQKILGQFGKSCTETVRSGPGSCKCSQYAQCLSPSECRGPVYGNGVQRGCVGVHLPEP
jgi:alpha-tubulin suppressor-like RCC1 family protein